MVRTACVSTSESAGQSELEAASLHRLAAAVTDPAAEPSADHLEILCLAKVPPDSIRLGLAP